MTSAKPSITYMHGFLDDCNDVTGWIQHDVGLGATLTTENDDWLKITGTPDAVGDEYTYYEKNIPNISSTLYPKLLVRWKTSAIAAPGLQAKITVWYDDSSSTETTLGFSAGWKTTTIDLPTGKMIAEISIYADDNPNTLAAGTFYVYFDFILICGGVFVFPNCAGGLIFTPSSRDINLQIVSRIGNVDQYMGADDATVECSCNLDIGNWKRTLDTVNGEVFMDIVHNSYREPFQWLDTGTEQFKVRLATPKFKREVRGSLTDHKVDLSFREFRRCSGTFEAYYERFSTPAGI